METAFDVIVVGSGMSGGWAAMEFCEKGLKVLLLERGKSLEHPNYPSANKNPWELAYSGVLTREDRERHHVQVRHYSISGKNKDFYINDLENPYEESKPYDWIRGDIVGGRSVLWGRQCYRWSDLDFKANLRDGIGVDWPVRYKDIAPWYDRVEKFIGVSGQAEGISHVPDGIFLPSMPFTCVEEAFKKSLEYVYPDRKLIMGRVANLTQAIPKRGKCQFRNRCDEGCPYGGYFSSNSGTLPAAMATGNLVLKSSSLVNRIIYDEAKGRASGVEVVDTTTNEVVVYKARIIFLNASTLSTTFILLNSISSRFPNGLGNGSDQVGRNLMDHHKGSGATARVEGFEDFYYAGRRPNIVYMPRFQNMGNGKRENFIRGYGFLGGGSRGGWHSYIDQATIGVDLKAAIQTPGDWGFWFQGYGECLPYPKNRVTLSNSQIDKWGRPVLSIDCEFGENEKVMNQHMAESMAEMLDRLGYKDVAPFNKMSVPGNANHEMGTARMGNDPKTSVLNRFNQMHEVPNVFITDGSFMTSGSCLNPSLTYMAFTARACAYAIEEMKRQNL